MKLHDPYALSIHRRVAREEWSCHPNWHTVPGGQEASYPLMQPLHLTLSCLASDDSFTESQMRFAHYLTNTWAPDHCYQRFASAFLTFMPPDQFWLYDGFLCCDYACQCFGWRDINDVQTRIPKDCLWCNMEAEIHTILIQFQTEKHNLVLPLVRCHACECLMAIQALYPSKPSICTSKALITWYGSVWPIDAWPNTSKPP